MLKDQKRSLRKMKLKSICIKEAVGVAFLQKFDLELFQHDFLKNGNESIFITFTSCR